MLDAVQIKSYRCILAGLSSLGLMLLNTLNLLGNNPTKHPIVGWNYPCAVFCSAKLLCVLTYKHSGFNTSINLTEFKSATACVYGLGHGCRSFGK